MKRAKSIISKNAEFDLQEISDWYNTIDKKLIWMFLKEFKGKVKFIEANPFSCEIRYENFRIAYLRKFPFGVHYQFDDERNIITIFSVFHTSRNPNKWAER